MARFYAVHLVPLLFGGWGIVREWGRRAGSVCLTALSDWGWGVKLLLVPAVPAGHSLLSAVGAETAASRGPGGGRPDLLSDLQGDRPSALGCYRDRLARRPRGNDTAPPVAGRKLDRLQAGP